MFTDRRVPVKVVDYVTQPVGAASVSGVALALVMHLLLGPIGWLVSAMMEGDEEGNRTVRKSQKLKLAQCHFCQDRGRPEHLVADQGKYVFRVHPRFQREFEMLNSEDQA